MIFVSQHIHILHRVPIVGGGWVYSANRALLPAKNKQELPNHPLLNIVTRAVVAFMYNSTININSMQHVRARASEEEKKKDLPRCR